MQQRNRLLADDVRDARRFEAFERIMAETGVAIAAARAVAVAELAAAIGARRDAGAARFSRGPSSPWWHARVGSGGTARLDVEDDYFALLRASASATGRWAYAGRPASLRSGRSARPQGMPAKVCSTGEQKALLVGLVLAHCDSSDSAGRCAPILLLDEITAHLDPLRRAALFEEVVCLGSQAWMSGTDPEAFAALGKRAQFFASRRPRHAFR
jgi:DNA replication and repair protein RecF